MRRSTITVLLLACSHAGGQAADEIHWTFIGRTAITLDWRGTENTVDYGPDTSYGSTATAATPLPVPFSSPGPFWEAKLTGLRGDALYHYRIGTGADHTFRTPPREGTSGFVVYFEADIGDTTSYPNVGVIPDLLT
jgi:hypothetical protein